MRIKTTLLTACLLIGFCNPSLLGSDDWIGVWRCIISEGPKVDRQPFHFAIDKENKEYKVALISPKWGYKQFPKVTFNGLEAILESPVRSKANVYQLKLNPNGRMTGTSDLIHSQYRIKRAFSGEKVLTDGKWTPQTPKDVPEGENFLDIHTKLFEAPLESFEEFEKFWDAEIEPPYYMIVMDLIYSPDKVGSDRAEKLKIIFENLKSEEYRERVKKFGTAWKNALKKIKEKADEV